MKSAAFNLAFKVHRNEIPFPEGLLKAVDADAQEDFIEALNSLAGETKYDVDRLEQMIQEASKDVNQEEKAPKIDVERLYQDLERTEKKRNELKDTVQNIESRTTALSPKIVPGINSFLLFIVGFVATIVFYLSGLVVLSVIFMICILTGAALFYIQDMSVYNKQLDEIKLKKERAKNEINKINYEIEDLNNAIEDLQKQIDSADQPELSTKRSAQTEQNEEQEQTQNDQDIPPLI